MPSRSNARTTRISVVTCDAPGLFADGLRAILDASPEVELLATATSLPELEDHAKARKPDVVVIGPHITARGSREGLSDAVTMVRAASPATKIMLIVTPAQSAESIIASVQASADAIVDAESSDAELVAAIREAHELGGFVSPGLALRLVRAGSTRGDRLLSEREAGVLAAIAYGYTNSQIADALCLSVRTVESERARIASKLGLRSRGEVVAYALENDLIHHGSMWHPHGGVADGMPPPATGA